ncbi:MAG: sporulation protein YqfD [Oscillospiraceae bacterium]|nr:sporulation protein YqfD [Oscillospiraceae bacterium]
MILTRLLRLLFGYICFTVQSADPERFLSELAKMRLPCWDIQRNDREESITLSMYLWHYRKIRSRLSPEDGIQIVLKEKRGGFPPLLFKNRLRIGIFAGTGALVAFCLVMSMFIWSVEVEGCESLTDAQILSAAEELGIYPGILRSRVDDENIERMLMRQFQEISWIAINTKGSKLTILLKERILPPDTTGSDHPANFVSDKTGVITKIEVHEGFKEALLGDTIQEGELLINGMITDKKGQNTLCRAYGIVRAEVEEPVKIEIPLFRTEKIYNELSHFRNTLFLFGLKIPLYFPTPLEGTFLLETERESLSFFGFPLPIDLEREILTEFIERQISLTPEEAEEILRNELDIFIKHTLRDATVLEERIEVIIEDETALLSGTVLCEETIGIQVPILTEENQ